MKCFRCKGWKQRDKNAPFREVELKYRTSTTTTATTQTHIFTNTDTFTSIEMTAVRCNNWVFCIRLLITMFMLYVAITKRTKKNHHLCVLFCWAFGGWYCCRFYRVFFRVSLFLPVSFRFSLELSVRVIEAHCKCIHLRDDCDYGHQSTYSYAQKPFHTGVVHIDKHSYIHSRRYTCSLQVKQYARWNSAVWRTNVKWARYKIGFSLGFLFHFHILFQFSFVWLFRCFSLNSILMDI